MYTSEEAWRVVEENSGLIGAVVRDFDYIWRSHHLDREDVDQELRIALHRAVLRFEPGRGVKFGAFAYRVLRNRLFNIGRDAARSRGWSSQPISGGDEDERGYDTVIAGLVDPASNFEEDLIARVDSQARAAIVQVYMATLSPRQQEILVRYYIRGEKDRQIAERLGVSKQYVNKVRNNSVRELRASVAGGAA